MIKDRPVSIEIEIDEAEPADYEAVARLSVEAYREFELLWGERWPLVVERLEAVAERAKEGVILVARAGGDPVGTATFHPRSDPERNPWPTDWAVLRRVAVAVDYRGVGIGRLLVEDCIDRAMSLESPALALRTMDFMTTARWLYERLGFDYVGEFAEPPVLAMAKRLRQD